MTVGRRIRHLRKVNQLTQKTLAKALDIPYQNLSNYERDFRQPDFRTLLLIADYFHVSTDYLLGRSNLSDIEKVEVDVAHTLSLIIHEMNINKEITLINGDYLILQAEDKDLIKSTINHSLKVIDHIIINRK